MKKERKKEENVSTYCRPLDPRQSHRDSHPHHRSARLRVCTSRWRTWTPSRCTCADLQAHVRSRDDNHHRWPIRGVWRTPIGAIGTTATACTCIAARCWKDASMFQRTACSRENVCFTSPFFSRTKRTRIFAYIPYITVKRGEAERHGSRHLRRRYFNRWSNIKAFNVQRFTRPFSPRAYVLQKVPLLYFAASFSLSFSLSLLFPPFLSSLISQRQKIVRRSFYRGSRSFKRYAKQPIKRRIRDYRGGETMPGRASEAKVADSTETPGPSIQSIFRASSASVSLRTDENPFRPPEKPAPAAPQRSLRNHNTLIPLLSPLFYPAWPPIYRHQTTFRIFDQTIVRETIFQ